MIIKQLKINHFRNLTSIDIELSPNFNFFYGENGSGKTSLLEAIYYLGFGKSFRTNPAGRIIQYNKESLAVFIQLQEENKLIPIGIERYHDSNKKIRIDGEEIKSIAPLAKRLAIQFISTDTYRYFSDGPKRHRQFLDWGVFHVEPEFFAAWQKLQHILKQRNACLKQQASHSEIKAWDEQLCHNANLVDKYRLNYIETFKPIFFNLMDNLLGITSLDLRYSRGWAKDQDLQSILQNTIYRDMQFGYTQSGPQRADLQIYYNNIPAQDVLSQGQQKLAAYALHLAQGIYMQQKTGQSPIYLIDDLPSELDLQKRSSVINVLTKLKSQIFITGILQNDMIDLVALDNTKLFHVERGSINIENYQEA